MNDRILPALGFTLRELLWGRRETRRSRTGSITETETTPNDAEAPLYLLRPLMLTGIYSGTCRSHMLEGPV